MRVVQIYPVGVYERRKICQMKIYAAQASTRTGVNRKSAI